MDVEAAAVEQGCESAALANLCHKTEELSAPRGRQGRSKRDLLLSPSWSGVGRSSTTLHRQNGNYLRQQRVPLALTQCQPTVAGKAANTNTNQHPKEDKPNETGQKTAMVCSVGQSPDYDWSDSKQALE